MISLYPLFRKMAFGLDPEKAHEATLFSFSRCPHFFAKMLAPPSDPRMQTKVGRLTWKFPVGLAAGLDKAGSCIDFFSYSGMGAMEVGTVTPRPQSGNDKPRLWRIPEENSLRNRLGFNYAGLEAMRTNILHSDRGGVPLEINKGKNKPTPGTKAPEDYRILYSEQADLAAYLVVNVSSPNTPGLRDLQQASALKEIFETLKEPRARCDKALFLKVSPDMADDDLIAAVEVAKDYALEGIIATNTIIVPDRGEGGVSGSLLRKHARITRKKVAEYLKETPEMVLIGVGGISHFDDLWGLWKIGGRGAQISTAYIYEGPGLLKRFYRDIDACLKKNGSRSVEELQAHIAEATR